MHPGVLQRTEWTCATQESWLWVPHPHLLLLTVCRGHCQSGQGSLRDCQLFMVMMDLFLAQNLP